MVAGWLMVPRIPEQLMVATMWHNVVNLGRPLGTVLGITDGADRVRLQICLGVLGPPVRIPTLVTAGSTLV